jgi:hypothetical protein
MKLSRQYTERTPSETIEADVVAVMGPKVYDGWKDYGSPLGFRRIQFPGRPDQADLLNASGIDCEWYPNGVILIEIDLGESGVSEMPPPTPEEIEARRGEPGVHYFILAGSDGGARRIPSL